MANAGKRLYIQPVTRQSPNPACRQSEGGMEGERARERERERERERALSSLFTPPSYLPSLSHHISAIQGPVKPLPTHPSPQLKVLLRQWLCFLHSILRKGQNRQRASCKAATNKRHLLYHGSCRLQHTVYQMIPHILPSSQIFTVGPQWYRKVTIPLRLYLVFDAGRQEIQIYLDTKSPFYFCSCYNTY